MAKKGVRKSSRRKAANGEGTVFPVPTGWKAVVIVGRKPNGRPITKSKTHKSKSVVNEWKREMLLSVGRGMVQSDMLFCDWVTLWLADVKKTRATNTFNRYSDVLEGFIVPFLGKYPLSKIRPITVRNLLASLEGTPKKPRRIKGGEIVPEDPDRTYAGTRSLDSAFEVLKTCLGAAFKMELLHRNPVSQVDRPKYTRKPIVVFEPSEVKAILKAAKEHRLYAMILLAFCTGLRAGELFGLHWSDIDFEAGTLTVNRQAIDPGGELQVKPPKTEAGKRTLTLPDLVVKALLKRRRLSIAEELAACEIVFPGANGKYLRANTFSKRIWKEKILKPAGVPFKGLHAIRHTFATTALVEGTPVHVVSKTLGHSNPSTTLRIYAHLLKDSQATASERVSKVFSGPPEKSKTG